MKSFLPLNGFQIPDSKRTKTAAFYDLLSRVTPSVTRCHMAKGFKSGKTWANRGKPTVNGACRVLPLHHRVSEVSREKYGSWGGLANEIFGPDHREILRAVITRIVSFSTQRSEFLPSVVTICFSLEGKRLTIRGILS